jgi:hypothetical protein
MNRIFPPLPSMRPRAVLNRPFNDPLNHQYDAVYSLNFGNPVLVRLPTEDEWRRAISNYVPPGTFILVREDNRGNYIARHMLLRTDESYRRISFLYRPNEI